MPIHNFGKVGGTASWGLILRSGQPSVEDFETLKELIGPFTSYRLSGETEGGVDYSQEKAALLSLNCDFVADHRLGDGMDPKLEDLKAIAKEINNIYTSGNTVLIHCIHGRERTGAVSAAWRVFHGGASTEEVLKDLETFGIKGLLEIVDHKIIEAVRNLKA